MNLSSEDQLRLNVLANNADAIRIDEGSMTVYGYSDKGEARIQLNPNGLPDQYIRAVKECLSGAVLGSPGGYPVFLKRWTRMGQQPDQHLGDLLKLGEDEAVMAVVCAPGLTPELARLAWWHQPTFDNARRMLARECVGKSEFGRELADFIIEFLPFETDSVAIIEGIRLILQTGLIDNETRDKIWRAGQRKSAFRVGFLLATPEDLPDKPDARALNDNVNARLRALMDEGNHAAIQLGGLFRPSGRAFMLACKSVINRPVDQDVVVALMHAMYRFFSPIDNQPNPVGSIADAEKKAREICDRGYSDTNPELAAMLQQVPELKPELQAALTLSRVGEPAVDDILGHTDAVGTVMKKRLEPMTQPVLQQFRILLGE
ncbi:MAG: sulfur reduction protein DsrS [Gammaproteobacteria bacterium]|nr:MAG: sulfur reduction protein DsrS [Gammaproteobacteria bacterium]